MEIFSNLEMLNGSKYIMAEIKQQPSMWYEVFKQIENINQELEAFISDTKKVIFFGAGSSEFVGNTLVSALNKKSDICFTSVATTDFITQPQAYLKKDEEVLCVSFARSGNSPESMATINLCDNLSKKVKHLIITCNIHGQLAKYTGGYQIILPALTNDKSFAMTSSFTSMIVAGYLAFNLASLKTLKDEMYVMCENASDIIQNYANKLQDIVSTQYVERVAILGSQSLKAFAKEGALKIMELSAGKSVAIHDSFLGYRHGPITYSYGNHRTLMLYFMNQDTYINKYEKDVMKELMQFKKDNIMLAVSLKGADVEALTDYNFEIKGELNEVFYGINCIIIAQLLGLYQSWVNDVKADTPFPYGECDGFARIYEDEVK